MREFDLYAMGWDLVLRDEHATGATGVGIHYTADVHCGRTGGDTEAPR